MTKLRIDFINHLKLSSFSDNTIKNYVNSVIRLANFYNKSPHLLTGDQIKNFLLKGKLSGQSETLLHSFYYAFKSFYLFMNTGYKMKNIPVPRRKYRTPTILNMEEINSLINACDGIQQKLFLSLLYSCGIRISELANLRLNDFDFERKTIFISKSKNRKQRYVLLSDKTSELLKYYFSVYRPSEFIFYRNEHKGSSISIRYLQNLFQKVVERSKINKKFSAHTLRHSFATHLLESGNNLFYIQKLLGHDSIQSTAMYLHADNSILMKIQSPIEKLNKEVFNPLLFLNQQSLNFKIA